MDMRPNGPQIAVFIDFENVALSAEASLGDFDVATVMNLLRTRGRLLIKRAYGDWGRFQRYRRPMLENGIDLIQLYAVGMQQKNRADVRLAIDALETVFTRPNIDIYAIVSGDSDFTELTHKLRDHGKYTIGIGLRAATSDLLRRACDEFIFYETLVAEELDDISDELQLPDPRDLLRRAMNIAVQKGEVPIFAGRLKQLMLGLDSSFSEANYGYPQFRAFLEAHRDLITIEDQGMQVYVSAYRPPAPAVATTVVALPAGDLRATVASPAETGHEPVIAAAALPPAETGHEPAIAVAALPPPAAAKPAADVGLRYRGFLRDAGLRVVEQGTRQQVLADFLAIFQARPEPLSLNAAADLLKDRYDAENALTQKVAVSDVMRLLLMAGALEFAGGQPGCAAPVRRDEALVLDQLVFACDSVFVWRLVEGGVQVYPDPLLPVLYDASADIARVTALCRDLVERRMIVPNGDSYLIAPEQISCLLQREWLAMPANDLAKVTWPPAEPITPIIAEKLFHEGSELRQKDFAGSSQRYLQAARVQLEALRAGQPRAGFDDLKWYLASYCSVKAGHAFVSGAYTEAAPYYLAFFSLAQEADSVWQRIQRLVNPMASYFFAIAGKQLNEAVPPNLGKSPASQVAVRIHNHPSSLVAEAWERAVARLAEVNLGIVRQVHKDLFALLGSAAQADRGSVAGQAGENTARIERTRTFLANLIARLEG